jgi:hypothetical protein
LLPGKCPEAHELAPTSGEPKHLHAIAWNLRFAAVALDAEGRLVQSAVDLSQQIGAELAVRGHVGRYEADCRERDHPDEEPGTQREAGEH